MTHNGNTLMSGGDDRTAKLWELSTGRLIRTFDGHADWIVSVAFSTDGTRAVSGSEDKTVRLWDVGTGQLIRTLGEEALK
jgi:WD40 repeat protein